MQNFRNYYEILGVTQDTTVEQLKKSYRQLARRYHPDLNPGDKAAEETFKAISEAYEILSDEDKRFQYDQYRRYWQQKGGRKGARKTNGNGTGNQYDFSQYGDFNTFVDQLRNRRQTTATAEGARVRSSAASDFRPGTTKTQKVVTAASPQRRDVEAKLTLPLEKAYQGGRERIRLEDGRSLEVEMPEGMVDGQRLRLKGQGMGGGDLYLKIKIAPHRLFAVQGNDIFCQVPITPTEAVLGGAIEVPTIDGLVKVTIPQGVRAGQRLRLASKGYPSLDGDRGDQLVEIQIVVPPELSEQERELYEKLRRLETYNPRRQLLQTLVP
ncbi:MAG: J domain-containing protein [Chloroflexaceae bacterium]|nr:J domain-containing protein [Chloroflexaceae bacterium]